MVQPDMVLDAYQIIKREADKPEWLKRGIAFINNDLSINLYLDAFPKDGKIHIRERKSPKTNQNNKEKFK